MKAEIYEIFNEIQTDTNTKENLYRLVSFYEKGKFDEFIDILQNVLMMIFKYHDKNTAALKNIKDFLKRFLEKIIKSQKLKKSNTVLIEYFCNLLTQNAKKHQHKDLCFLFLNVFLSPYNQDHQYLYKEETLEEIKNFVIMNLKQKKTNTQMLVLKFLQKNPTLQKDPSIWDRLEFLLNNSHQNVKKEILKLLSINDPNTLKYLIDMYDDESPEIRHFVFDKISELEDFDLIKPADKLRLLYVGLSDTSQKVHDAAVRFLKKFTEHLKIIKSSNSISNSNNNNNKEVNVNKEKRNENLMDIEDDFNAAESNNNKKEKPEEEEAAENKELTVHEKIIKASSPIKAKNKLQDSPFRLFDHLDSKKFYNHPKLSYAFNLITAQLVELIDFDDLVDYVSSIVDNLALISCAEGLSSGNYNNHVNNNNNNNKAFGLFSTEKVAKRNSRVFSSAGNSQTKAGKVELFNDVFFLQNLIYLLQSKSSDKKYEALESAIMSEMPDIKTFTTILNHYYEKEPNMSTLHQLFLISQYLTYDEELGIREISNFLRKFLMDYNLETKNILEQGFSRQLELFPSFTSAQNSQNEISNFENTTEKNLKDNNYQAQAYGNRDLQDFNFNNHFSKTNLMEIKLENTLLAPNRKVILSLDDLIEFGLKILLKIHYKEQQKLSNFIMEIVADLKELVSEGQGDAAEDKENIIISELKKKEKNIIKEIKEKLIEMESLKENLNKKKEKNALDATNRIYKIENDLDQLDDELREVKFEESAINARILKLCLFVIKFCRNNHQFFNDMATQIMVPFIREKKGEPNLINESFFAMGLMSITYYKEFSHYFKLFEQTLENSSKTEFKEFQMKALFIFFDIILLNNLTVKEDDKTVTWIDKNLEPTIKHFLYHQNANARLITLLGLCKLLLSNKISRPEHFLCRMVVVLYKSFEYTDTKREDFHVKIYEIMSSFIYFYVNSGKAANKSLVNSILIIFLSQIIGQSNFDYKSVFTEFQETKLEFINQFLKMICESDQDVKKPRKILFRIFKFVYFLAEFVQEETDIENIQKSVLGISLKNKAGKVCEDKSSKKKGKAKAKGKVNENKMDIVDGNDNNAENENENLEAENINENDNLININEEEEEEEKKAAAAAFKKIKLTIKVLQNIKTNIKKFLEKTKYDSQLFSDFTDEKFLKITTMLNSCDFLSYFSSEAQEQFNEIKDNDFKIERNGIETDLKERMENFGNYVESKREKYYAMLNGFFAFEEIVKRENIGAIIEENSLMVDDEEDMSVMNVGAGNNNITNVINNNNNKTRRNNARNSSSNINNNNNILDGIDEEGEEDAREVGDKNRKSNNINQGLNNVEKKKENKKRTSNENENPKKREISNSPPAARRNTRKK